MSKQATSTDGATKDVRDNGVLLIGGTAMDLNDLRAVINDTLLAQHPGDTDKRVWNADLGMWMRPGDFVFETRKVDVSKFIDDKMTNERGKLATTKETLKEMDAIKPARFVVNLKRA